MACLATKPTTLWSTRQRSNQASHKGQRSPVMLVACVNALVQGRTRLPWGRDRIRLVTSAHVMPDTGLPLASTKNAPVPREASTFGDKQQPSMRGQGS